MGFEVGWLVPGKIIHIKVLGKISLEELKDASDLATEMYADTDAPLIHMIIDESEMESLPASIKAFAEAATIVRNPRTGWMIMYGTDDPMARFMSTMITGMTKVRHRRFNNFQESLEFITTVDSTLPTVEEMLGY